MIKIFRKIRHKLLSENKFSKYVIYAIGEIVLVVIGILIALFINNWNENRKNQNQLTNIYKEIEINLKTDLSNIDAVIEEYEQLDLRLEKMVSDEYSNSLLDSITSDNYTDCIPCLGDINSYIPFEIQNKGLQLLNSFNGSNTLESKMLTNEIIQFYSISESINSILDKLEEESFNNIKFFEQFPWYSDFMSGTYNPETILFFAENEIFKNKVITYRLIAVQNYLPVLIYYKESANTLLKNLDKFEYK